MTETTRTANAHWEGNVGDGGGNVDLASSKAAGGLPFSLPARTSEETGGQTSPEELLAGAHAGCYAMALSLVLTQGGNPPDALDASADVALAEASGGGYEISHIDLNVRGRVPGLDADGFEQAARDAEQACTVSNALRGNVQINLNAEFEGG